MDKLSQYYIHIKDDEIITHLPSSVSVENHTVVFNNEAPLECEIIYEISSLSQLTMNYIFKRFVHVNLIERHILLVDTQINKIMELKEQSQVHLFHQNNSKKKFNISINEEVHIHRDAMCQCGFSEFSYGDINSQYTYHLDGENASAYVRMAIVSQQSSRKNYQVTINHHAPHTYGQMDNYGVAKDESRLTIDGIGTITKGQHGSSSHQTNKIMVFDESVIASANPYLYIDEYDVKASHAAAVGKMDEEHLYYLQSRGLTKQQAMHLITYGYLHPVVEVINNEQLKKQFEEVLLEVGG